MLDDLKPMAIFVETVELGSFRQAARKLQLSPSVISHHVAALEKRLGCTLIYRSTRKLSLTEEGRVLFEHAQQMLQLAKFGIDQISPNSPNPIGKLTLSIPALFAHSKFTQYIAEFMASYPNISLNIQSTDERLNIIEHGIDLAVRLGGMVDSSLKAVKVGEISRVLVCTPELLERFGKPDHPSELSDWPWLSLSMLKNSRKLVKYAKKAKKIIEEYDVNYVSKHTINSVDYLSRLCECGAGLATPPLFMVEELIATRTLVGVCSDWQVEPVDIYLVWPPNSVQSSLTRLFIDFLKSKSLLL